MTIHVDIGNLNFLFKKGRNVTSKGRLTVHPVIVCLIFFLRRTGNNIAVFLLTDVPIVHGPWVYFIGNSVDGEGGVSGNDSYRCGIEFKSVTRLRVIVR